MTEDVANFIKNLRLGNPSYSWRAVSREVAETFPNYIDSDGVRVGDFPGDQLMGWSLCREASDFLNLPELAE